MARYDINGKRLGIKTPDDLEAETAKALVSLRQHGASAAVILKAHQARVRAIRNDPYLSESGKRQQIDASKARMQAEAEALQQQREQAQAALTEAYQMARTPSGDSAAQLLAFQQQQAAWARAQKYRAAGQDWYAIIQAAGERGDTAMLAALRVELPAELAALDKTQPGYSGELVRLIHQAETPHTSALEQAVRAQEAQVSYLASAATFNEAVLSQAVASPDGQPGMHFLQGPDREAIPLAGDA